MPLVDAEKRMLRWSEVIPGLEASKELNDAFEEVCDTSDYEEKVAGLLERARQGSKESETAIWTEAMQALRGQDAYILVMVTRSGVDGAPLTAAAPKSIRDQLWVLLWGTLAGLVIVGAIVYFALQ